MHRTNNPSGIRTWNDARDAELRRLWGLHWTSKKIAEHLRVSKNSVIGRAHRLGLSKRPSPIKRCADGVHSTPTRRGRPPIIRNRAQALKAEGRNVNEIAAELNTEREVVKLLLTGMTWARARALCRPKAPEPVKLPVPPPKPAAVQRAVNGDGCRWTDSSQAPWVWCGEPTNGGSWCAAHHSRVFQKREAAQ